jgi:16S rRNA (cytosine1402-N4)-methyltransferase
MNYHVPVMVREVIEYMSFKENGVYCDCTTGGAGHLTAFLQETRHARFIGIDCDPDAIMYARRSIAPYADRCVLVEDNFINIGLILKRHRMPALDGVLFDLGVSYHQLTTAERGFSFERDGDLLMNMSPSSATLRDKLRSTSKEELLNVLREYGDVHQYRRIGRALYEHRQAVSTTTDIRDIVMQCMRGRYKKKNLHRVFQALRIWVNDELENLRRGLREAYHALKIGGRFIVISYHSGEDRIVKHTFRDWQKRLCMTVFTKKVKRPGQDEVERNPRARSARLRAGEKCACS